VTERRDAAARFPHLRWWLAGIAALALLVAYHAWWLVRVRHHYPVDIDEAGYISIALNDLAGLRAHGLGGLWDAFQQQTPNAPLVPLLAVPALAVHKAVLPVFAVELAALVVVVLATYGLARRLAGPRWAVLAALSVAAVPGIVNYAREFSFALPCTAALTVSLWALLRSDHLTRRWMVLLWGAAGGVAVLARTMAIGYMPGLVLAGVLWAALAPAPARRAALVNALGGAAAGIAVAAVWYWRNLPYVLDYLRGFGYGATASQYGTKHSVLSAAWWYDDLDVAARQELFMPLFVLLALVLACGLVLAVRGLAARRGKALLVGIRSPAAPLVVVVVSGYLSLATTANVGSAFALPLLPTVVVLVVALAAQIPVRQLRVAAAAGFVLVAAVQLVSFAQIGGPLDRIRLAGVWPFPEVPIVDPRGPAIGAVGVTPNELRFGPRDRGWIELAGQVGSLTANKTWSEGRLPILAFASRDRLLNINMVALASLLSPAGGGLPLAQLTADGGDTAAAYRRFLTDPAHGQPNVLAISDGERNDYEPTVTQAHVAAAARSLGFTPFATVRQPNGELVRLWWLRRGAAIPSPPSPG
jgi:4-amino-4-deoxy-L-arabinose transferase-like glycosyltransferase